MIWAVSAVTALSCQLSPSPCKYQATTESSWGTSTGYCTDSPGASFSTLRPGRLGAGALLILVLGHGLNFLLSVSSGFIHGLRLNVIEFFKWGVRDDGFPYRPFDKKESN